VHCFTVFVHALRLANTTNPPIIILVIMATLSASFVYGCVERVVFLCTRNDEVGTRA